MADMEGCNSARREGRQMMPASFARIITAMLDRCEAGEYPPAVAADYGPWEFDKPPDLSRLSVLHGKREAK